VITISLIHWQSFKMWHLNWKKPLR